MKKSTHVGNSKRNLRESEREVSKRHKSKKEYQENPQNFLGKIGEHLVDFEKPGLNFKNAKETKKQALDNSIKLKRIVPLTSEKQKKNDLEVPKSRNFVLMSLPLGKN